MQKFIDSLGREWSVSLTVAELEQILEQTNVDVGRTTDIAKLFEDTRVFLKVLWVFIGDQIRVAGVTEQDVKRAIDADAMGRAVEAVQREILFFSPNRQHIAKLADAIKDRQERLIGPGIERVIDQINAGTLDSILLPSGPTLP